MKKNIKQFLRKYFPKIFVMNYYDEDELYTLTTYLTEHVFPKNGTVVSVPVAVDNTINNVYYLLTLPDENILVVKIGFNAPIPVMEIVDINMRHFELFNFTSFIEHICINFLKHRINLSQIFTDIKHAKEVANRRR